MLDLVLCVANGIYDISYRHLGDRFILCIGAALSLLVFRYFRSMPLAASLAIHFFACIIMMLLYVWTGSFFEEPHPDAYRDAVRTVFIIYPVIIISGLVIDVFRTAKANRILKSYLQTEKQADRK
jgi:hypothetical protein